MLDTLRKIVQEVGAAQDLDQALNIAVKRIKQSISADVCSVYLTDHRAKRHVLMATDGLNPSAVGRVALPFGEGVVSVVAESAEPLNLDNAPDHPSYQFAAETGEEFFHGFLGVPIIHHRRLVGVLVIRQRQQRRFLDDEVAFIVTLAAQLAGAIAHAEISGDISRLVEGTAIPTEGYYIEGLEGAPGVGMGTARVVFPSADLNAVPDRPASDSRVEIANFHKAVTQAQREFQKLGKRLSAHLSEEERMLFEAYSLMLSSESLTSDVIQRIEAGNWAAGALRDTITEHARAFEAMEDPYLRERAQDVRDVGQRLLACLLQPEQHVPDYPEKTILAGDEITASMLAEVPRERLMAVVSAKGSRLSHVAILARALGVPAVVGASELPFTRIDNRELIVDGYSGRIYLDPSPSVRAEYLRLSREEAELGQHLAELKELPAETPDGIRIPLHVNTGLLADIGPSLSSGAEGIGLYRTEFPFMVRDRFPGEDEQCGIYRQVLEAFAPRPVVLRTLDVGGDKPLPYFPINEDNPFLGWRGIRISLDHPELFLVQVRAMLRASQGFSNLHLLLPMVCNLEELDSAKTLVAQAYREISETEQDIAMPKLGVMIEVPSAALQSTAIAKRVDFLSIGTNDLTQYLLAVDRNNARVADLYDALHPAVLLTIQQVVTAGHEQGIPVGVCGELAGDPCGALALLAMGIDSLSSSASSLPRIKWVIRNFRKDQADILLREILAMENASDIRQRLCQAIEEAGLGGLIRAGR